MKEPFVSQKQMKQLVIEAFNYLEGGDGDQDEAAMINQELSEATAHAVHLLAMQEADDAGQLQTEIRQHLQFIPGHWIIKPVSKKKSK